MELLELQERLKKFRDFKRVVVSIYDCLNGRMVADIDKIKTLRSLIDLLNRMINDLENCRKGVNFRPETCLNDSRSFSECTEKFAEILFEIREDEDVKEIIIHW